ncbi:zinc finger protein 845-like isoform X2 [Dermacentor albipictus]|uniref:zinc finger protein 845-like isoform X2 n=1 Tax=Dermacentor albipictus TaxID=60249 RepID=UPI0031FBA84A
MDGEKQFEPAALPATMTSVTSSTSSSETSTESDTMDSDSEVSDGTVGASAKKPGKSVGTCHECSVCGQRFASWKSAKIHLAKHACEEPYACTNSSQKFTQKANVVKYQQVHTGKVRFVCEQCPSKFNSKIALDRHEQLHASGVEFFHCPECFKTLLLKTSLQRHLKWHKMEKPYSCHLCPATFVYEYVRDNHVLLHTNGKPYSCHLCQKCFAWKTNLDVHVRRIHGEIKTTVTNVMTRVEVTLPSSASAMLPPTHEDVDGEELSEPASLQPRVTSVASLPSLSGTSTDTYTTDSDSEISSSTLGAPVKKPGRSVGRCHESSECRKNFTKTASAENSLPEHTSNRTRTACPICGRVFAYRHILKRHQRTHHRAETQFVCRLCPSIFKKKSSLDRHKRLHTRAVGLYHCHKCGKIFKRKGILRQHLTWHEKKTSYKCHLCPASYLHRCERNNHVQTHAAEKPHRCPMCKKSYTWRRSLTMHMRCSHGGVKLTEECHDVSEKDIAERAALLPSSTVTSRDEATVESNPKSPGSDILAAVTQGSKGTGLNKSSKCSVRGHCFVPQGEKLHKCPVRKQTFAQKHSLATQEVTHSCKKQLPCSTCGELVKRKNLTAHELSHQSEKSL